MRPVRNLVFLVMGIGTAVLAARWGWEVAGLFVATGVLVPVVDRRIAAKLPRSAIPRPPLPGTVLQGPSGVRTDEHDGPQ